MPLLSKREWAGVAMFITGCAAFILFGASVYFGVLWWKDPLTYGQTMEPRTVVIALVIQPILWASFFLARWLREKAPVTDKAATEKVALEWASTRGDLIKTVRKHWIEDYLRHSLVEEVRIRLHAKKTPEALQHPFSVERFAAGRPERLTDNTLLRLFDESGGSLLILGEPGGGKTFTLVQLLDALLKRTDEDATAPVPVIVPLASWAIDQLPLEQWLAKELLHHYGLSARTTPHLLAGEKRLALLLDGLDEVREDVRMACASAIQRFTEHFTISVVICCRAREYSNLSSKFSRGESIRVLPLTSAQIDKYFDDLECGTKLDTLRKAVMDPHWDQLASTPLMLNLLALVFTEEDAPQELTQIGNGRRDAIFFRYVRLMLKRKEHHITLDHSVPEKTPYSKGQTIYWLQQIAQGMVRMQSTTFYIERLAPGWVQSHRIFALCCVLMGLLIFGLFAGLILGLMRGLFGGLILGLALGLIFGLLSALLDWRRRSNVLVESVCFHFNRDQLIEGLIVGLIIGLFAGLIDGLTVGLIVGLFGCLTLGLICGLIETRSHPRPAQPNQGIHSSIKQCLIAVGLAALFGGGTAWLLFAFGNHAVRHLWSLPIFIMCWMAFLFFGAASVTVHYSTRLALAWEGSLPFPLRDRRLVAFLDAMRDRLLLTRVGGGWIFIHRELLDYLAAEPFGSSPAEIERTLETRAP